METIINACLFWGSEVRTIVYYSHIIPIVLSVALGVFIFIKARYNLFSKVFLAFIISFSLWLIFDLIAWNASDYNLIYAAWAILDYLEIVFYVLGLYFALVFVRQIGISKLAKFLLFMLTLVPLVITLRGGSVAGFNQPFCEAFNNEFLGIYKLVVEGIILAIILGFMAMPFIKKLPWPRKKAELIVLGSMFIFLATFGVTEYVASITGNYEMNLYSLFLLPVFIVAIIYAVFELDIFNFQLLSTQYLVFGLIILSGGQLFFVSSSTDRLMTILTLGLTIGLSIILYRNLRRESAQRIRIEKLSFALEDSNSKLEGANSKLEVANNKLKDLDKLKTEFLSLAAHQLRSPLTAIKGYTSMLLSGDFGTVGVKQKEAINRVFESSIHLSKVVEDLLNVSKIEAGGMKYEMAPFDLEKAVKDLATDLSVTAEKKGLKLTFDTDKKSPYNMTGDMEKLRQVVLNVIDNAIKYTEKGSISVMLSKDEAAGMYKVAVTDTGMGISAEEKEKLFQKFSRGAGGKTNTGGSGLGLYLAKTIAEAHKGHVVIDSPGVGLGSTFSIELKA
jgi:signal transduction histidine kinase